jgi:hypothetical protein
MLGDTGKECKYCGRDRGPYTDMCDLCWQLRKGLDFLEWCPVGFEESLKRHGLKKVGGENGR